MPISPSPAFPAARYENPSISQGGSCYSRSRGWQHCGAPSAHTFPFLSFFFQPQKRERGKRERERARAREQLPPRLSRRLPTTTTLIILGVSALGRRSQPQVVESGMDTLKLSETSLARGDSYLEMLPYCPILAPLCVWLGCVCVLYSYDFVAQRGGNG